MSTPQVSQNQASKVEKIIDKT